jgi:hypothetical protein
MNGLSGARVVLLDDESTAALPVIKALSRAGIPVAFFDGKEAELPKNNKKLRGVRLAILDMDLGFGGSNENIAATLVQTFGRIIDRDNGPYGILIWTNHPDLKQKVAQYIYEHADLPNPVFIEMLKKADFKKSGKGNAQQFSIIKLSKELLKVLAENSPLECMQVWEGTCFRAATNVTNSIASLGEVTTADLDQWRLAWRDETLKLLFVISKAHAEEHHTLENCIPSIFLALDPLHSDRMDVLVERLAEDLSEHAAKIMAAKGGSAVERKAKVNTMLHLASDQLDNYSPGNLFVFGNRNRPAFMPPLKDVLRDCIQGNDPAQRAENLKLVLKHVHLCGLEVTPVCDHAQNKIGLSRLVAGFAVAHEQLKKIKGGQFLKAAGPFYFSDKPFATGSYTLFLNSRYVATAKPSQVKKLRAKARVRTQLLADVQSWASYQGARQGVMMLG